MEYIDENKRQPAILIVEETLANEAQIRKMNRALECMQKERDYPQLDICIVGFNSECAGLLQEFSLLEDVEMMKVPSAAEDAADEEVSKEPYDSLAGMMLGLQVLRVKLEAYDKEGIEYYPPVAFLLADEKTLHAADAAGRQPVNPAALMAFAADFADVECPHLHIFSSEDAGGDVLPYWLEWPLTAALPASFKNVDVDEADMHWMNIQAFYTARSEEE